jgi:Na+/phosphate symporter
VVGIGVVLLSLCLIGTAMAPLRDAAMLPSLSGYLAEDYVTAFLVGALFTWLIHSSVAAILMVATFVNFHVLFNAALLLAGLPFVTIMTRLIGRLLPDVETKAASDDSLQNRVTALDRSVITTPRLALASATRELLRMGELVEIMVRPVMDLLRAGEHVEITRVRDIDNAVNQAHTDITSQR